MKTQYNVAIFPIPNLVSFPGTQVPLHVFEPRYRAMIKHCIENNVLLAIAHTKKIKGSIKKIQQNIDTLNKNQTSYEPHPIFSAGECTLMDTTVDGHMHVEVNVKKRLQIIEIKQNIPFKIATCEELTDESETEMAGLEKDKMTEIYELLLAISQSQSPQLHEIINQPEWGNAKPAEFSFMVFKYFRFKADFMQHVLEQTSVSHRLDLIWQGITHSLMPQD